MVNIVLWHTPWGYDEWPAENAEDIVRHALNEMTKQGCPGQEIYCYRCWPMDPSSETFAIRVECSEEMAEWAWNNGWILIAGK